MMRYIEWNYIGDKGFEILLKRLPDQAEILELSTASLTQKGIILLKLG